MSENIPYGYKDNGESDVRKTYGTCKGFKKYQEQQEAQRIESARWLQEKRSALTINEADALMNKIRQNPKAHNFENFTRNNDSTEHDQRDA